MGGTKVAVARIDGTAVHDYVEQPTDVSSGEALLAGIEAAVRETGVAADVIGVGVPSQVDFASGTVVASVNIPLAGVPLKAELERRLGAPVHVDNDANAAGLAEAKIAGARNLVMLTLGTGVGGGIVIDGRIFRGATGLGAELGHFPIEADGPECPGGCPGRGCIEALCSGTALEREATEFARANPDSPLGRLAAGHGGRVKGRQVVEAAREGDEGALGLLDHLGRRLGAAIAGVVNVFEPEQVVIGGGLSRAGDLILPAAEREASARALPVLYEKVTVSLARAGAEAGVIGAGLLAAHEHAGVDTAHDIEGERGT